MSPDVIITISITSDGATTAVEPADVSRSSPAADIPPPPDVDEAADAVPAPPQADADLQAAAVGEVAPPEIGPDEDLTYAVPEAPPA